MRRAALLYARSGDLVARLAPTTSEWAWFRACILSVHHEVVDVEATHQERGQIHRRDDPQPHRLRHVKPSHVAQHALRTLVGIRHLGCSEASYACKLVTGPGACEQAGATRRANGFAPPSRLGC